MSKKMRILIIDDDAELLGLLAKAVTAEGYTVATAGDGLDGLRLAGLESYDLVITDIFMPGMDGIALIKGMRKNLPGISVIAMSGGGRFGDMQSIKDSGVLGAIYTLSKPFNLGQLLELIRIAIG